MDGYDVYICIIKHFYSAVGFVIISNSNDVVNDGLDIYYNIYMLNK